VQVPVKVLFDDGVNDAVSGNLKKGDRVITEGQLRVIPGAKVTVSGAKRPAPRKGEMTSGRRRVPHAQDRQG
jgi:multidrug efflux system membrane fusion protein